MVSDLSEKLRQRLTGELVGLARPTDGNEHLQNDGATAVIVAGLLATGAFSDVAALEVLLGRVEEEKRKMVPDCFTCACPCGKNNAYDMAELRNDPEDIRALKELLLENIRAIAACARQASDLGFRDENVERFLYKALIAIGMDGWEPDRLLIILLEAGEANRKCLALLERAYIRNA